MTLFLSATIKVSLLVLAALGLTAVLRGRSAAVRHWVLAMALASGLVVPLFELVSPTWSVPLPAAWTSTSSESSLQFTSEPLPNRPGLAADAVTGDAASAGSTVPYTTLLVWAWAAGIFAGLGLFATGMDRLRRLVARSRPMDDERWQRVLRDVSCQYDVRRPVVLFHSPHPTMVVTWGLGRPTILLPTSAPNWSDERIQVVLRHELAHVRRGDWAIMLGATLLRCLYWFNPLVWIAVRRLRHESERSCDDLVLSAGVSGTDYATHLLEIARETALLRHAVAPAIALAHPSTLEGRIRAMLNTKINRAPLTGRGRVLMLVLALAAVLPIGAATVSARATSADTAIDVVLPPAPAPASRATSAPIEAPALAVLVSPAAEAGQVRPGEIEGVLYDPFGGLLPGALVTLVQVSTGGRYESTTDRNGAFAFRSLPAAEYELTTSLPGFSTVTNQIRLTDGASVRRHITLPLGSITETVSVGCGTGAATPAPVSPASPSARDAEPKVPALFSGGIGGQIKAPHKLVHVNPRCPGGTQDAHVRIEGRIGIDGLLSDLHDATPAAADGSSHAEYLASAVEAIRQWEFSPTLLNGAPVEVNILVTVYYSRSE